MAKNAVFYHHQLSLQEDQGIDMTQVSYSTLNFSLKIRTLHYESSVKCRKYCLKKKKKLIDHWECNTNVRTLQ